MNLLRGEDDKARISTVTVVVFYFYLYIATEKCIFLSIVISFVRNIGLFTYFNQKLIISLKPTILS